MKHFSGYNFFLWILSLLLLCGIGYGSFFIYQAYRLGEKINPDQKQSQSFFNTLQSFTTSSTTKSSLRNHSGRINILLLGTAGIGKPGQNLTDTIMVASIDTKTYRVALLSIPRDLYVSVPDLRLATKINSVYQYGLSASEKDTSKAADLVKETVSSITGVPLDYYAILNFDGFEKVINDIGGINIISEHDIYDECYPGANYSYETFQLVKGFHHLDGSTALKYARERHDDPEGDFGRAKRQQQIMQATKSKIFSADTLINLFTINDLFNTLGDNIRTDVATEEFPEFFELIQKLDTHNINNVVIDAWNKESLLKVSHIQYGDVRAFVLVPRVGNYSEIHELAENIFDLNQIKRRKEAISQEAATLTIINQSGDDQIISKIKKVLTENLNYQNIHIQSPATRHIQEKTIVFDVTDGQKPFTLDELALKLPAEISYDVQSILIPSSQEEPSDMLIIVGRDLIEKYNIEEATLEDLNNAHDDQENLEYSPKN